MILIYTSWKLIKLSQKYQGCSIHRKQTNFSVRVLKLLRWSVFWVVRPCSIMEGYQGFGGKYCYHLQASQRTWLRLVSVPCTVAVQWLIQLHPPTNLQIFIYIVANETVKVKVKLSLCLTKHHAMETYWGAEVELHAIFDLGTRWRWMISFTPRPPQIWSGHGVKEKNFQPPPRIEIRSSDRPFLSQSLYRLRLITFVTDYTSASFLLLCPSIHVSYITLFLEACPHCVALEI
jgi:hypothetical protein